MKNRLIQYELVQYSEYLMDQFHTEILVSTDAQLHRHQQLHCWLCNHAFPVVWVNSLAPGRFQFNFRKVIFKLTLVNGGCGISFEIALRWMPQDLTDKSTLVQVMAWCRQATSHYLSQCWPRSMLPNGVTRPQWVKIWAWCDPFSNNYIKS